MVERTGHTAALGAKTGRRRVLLVMSWVELHQLEGIYRYAIKAGWVISVVSTDNLDCLRHFKPHGALYQLHQAADPAMITSVTTLGIPTVDMYRFSWPPSLPAKYDYRNPRTVPGVYVDTHAAGALAARHLAACGYSRLAFVGGRDSNFHRGFAHAAEQLQCPVTLISRNDPLTRHQTGEDRLHSLIVRDECALRRQKWVGRTFAKLAKPVGVFVDDYTWASDVIDGCMSAGILVPEHVGVVAAVDAEFQGSCFSVPVTAIAPDYAERGYQAAALLDRMMNGDPVPPDTCILVPPKPIIQRDSTRVHAVDNIVVNRATHYILKHFHRDSLMTDDVVAAAGTSASTLYRAFARHLGMSVADYIEKLRLKEATTLLETTDLTASIIADQCGFGNLEHLRRVMQRATGATPTQYREKRGSRGMTA